MLYKIAYRSIPVREFSREELEAMLVDFRAKNQRLDITGLLLYRANSFIQFLEGEELKVMALFGQIRTDERHENVHLFLHKPIETRVFPDWMMRTRVFPDWWMRFRWLDGEDEFNMSDLTPQNIQQLVRDYGAQ